MQSVPITNKGVRAILLSAMSASGMLNIEKEAFVTHLKNVKK
jgi:hypothetical protein